MWFITLMLPAMAYGWSAGRVAGSLPPHDSLPPRARLLGMSDSDMDLPPPPQPDHTLLTDRDAIADATRRPCALPVSPASGSEGIYSLQLAGEGDAGDEEREIVVCFEDLDDAERYATMLTAQDFPEARPVSVPIEQLFDFCDEGGHILGLARRGSLIVPPQANAEAFGWSPGTSAEASEPMSDEAEAQRAALEALFSMEPEAPEEES